MPDSFQELRNCVIFLYRKSDPNTRIEGLLAETDPLLLRAPEIVHASGRVERLASSLSVPKDDVLRVGRRQSFCIDSQLAKSSQSAGKTDRPLVPWGGFSGSAAEHLLGSASPSSDWDQFSANKRLFGVNAGISFNENLYTIPLDRSSAQYQALKAEVEEIAAEIEAGRSCSTIDDALGADYDHQHPGADEELKFAQVSRPSTKSGVLKSSSLNPDATPFYPTGFD